MRVLGIDLGLKGALAFVDNGNIDCLLDMPVRKVGDKSAIDLHQLRDDLVNIGPVNMVVLEHVGSMPGNGSTSMFNFGWGAGAIEGLLVAMDRPICKVRPRIWTRDLDVGKDKDLHRLEAARLFPSHSDHFARKKDDGRADAALLAYWWGSIR